MVSSPLAPQMWPGLLTLKFPTGEAPLTASMQGRSGTIRGADPLPSPRLLPTEGNNPFIPDFIEKPLEEKISGLMKNGLIAVTGIIILAIGLLALVLQARGGSIAS